MTALSDAAPIAETPLGGPLPEGVQELRLRIRGVEQRVLAAGPEGAPPLVLLHGIGGSADEWLGVMMHFARDRRVIAPDAPGHGFSEKPAGAAYDLEGYAGAVRGVMDAVGMRRAPVVAVSGGGAVALKLALDSPERAERLVLVDAAGLGRDVSWSYRLATLPLARQLFRRVTNRRRIEAFGRALLYRPERLPAGWVDRRLRIWATAGAVDAFFGTVKAGLTLRGQRHSFDSRLRDVRQPVLIVWGRRDRIIPVAHGIAAARALPDARLHVFEECGHMPIWEYPDEFVRLVRDFLGDPAAG